MPFWVLILVLLNVWSEAFRLPLPRTDLLTRSREPQGTRGGVRVFAAEVDDMAVSRLPDLSQAAFPDIPEEPYDLIVLGSGPAGETAAGGSPLSSRRQMRCRGLTILPLTPHLSSTPFPLSPDVHSESRAAGGPCGSG